MRVRDLRFAYSKSQHELLGGLSHDFAPGLVTALTGPSGRGKSTLLHVMALLLTPRSGDVLLDGIEVSRSRDATRASIRATRIGFVFQDSELDPSRRVIESILEPAMYAGRLLPDRQERALGLLAQFGLHERAHHRPGQISGGEAQRVALCRALINDPDLLLADEPTGNLDQGNAQLVLDTLTHAAHQRGRTVIIATHDPFVLRHVDQVVQL